MRSHLHVGSAVGGGSVRCTSPYALTYWTTLHTFDETQRYHLCHYDVVVAQLVALGFIKGSKGDGDGNEGGGQQRGGGWQGPWR